VLLPLLQIDRRRPQLQLVFLIFQKKKEQQIKPFVSDRRPSFLVEVPTPLIPATR
jgi:hypothetical protein